MPELRLVVLAVQDKLAYGPTFSSALAALFGTAPSTLNETESVLPPQQSAAPNAQGAQAAPGQQQLIRQANQDFSEYQQLTSQGKLTEAGQKLDDLKGVLARLKGQSK